MVNIDLWNRLTFETLTKSNHKQQCKKQWNHVGYCENVNFHCQQISMDDAENRQVGWNAQKENKYRSGGFQHIFLSESVHLRLAIEEKIYLYIIYF